MEHQLIVNGPSNIQKVNKHSICTPALYFKAMKTFYLIENNTTKIMTCCTSRCTDLIKKICISRSKWRIYESQINM